mgnify:CR=1 FL=1
MYGTPWLYIICVYMVGFYHRIFSIKNILYHRYYIHDIIYNKEVSIYIYIHVVYVATYIYYMYVCIASVRLAIGVIDITQFLNNCMCGTSRKIRYLGNRAPNNTWTQCHSTITCPNKCPDKVEKFARNNNNSNNNDKNKVSYHETG